MITIAITIMSIVLIQQALQLQAGVADLSFGTCDKCKCPATHISRKDYDGAPVGVSKTKRSSTTILRGCDSHPVE